MTARRWRLELVDGFGNVVADRSRCSSEIRGTAWPAGAWRRCVLRAGHISDHEDHAGTWQRGDVSWGQPGARVLPILPVADELLQLVERVEFELNRLARLYAVIEAAPEVTSVTTDPNRNEEL